MTLKANLVSSVFGPDVISTLLRSVIAAKPPFKATLLADFQNQPLTIAKTLKGQIKDNDGQQQ